MKGHEPLNTLTDSCKFALNLSKLGTRKKKGTPKYILAKLLKAWEYLGTKP